MIEILSTQIVNYNGVPLSRHAEIIVTSGGDSYLWRVGGLPLEGDLQAILDAREVELFTAAQAGGKVAPGSATAQVGAKAWYLENPNAALLFELPIEDLQTEVAALVNALFPTATVGNKNKMILLLMTLSVSQRVMAKREGFVD